jgi:Domain of unknown function (DUF4442)
MNEKSIQYQKQVLNPFLFTLGMLKRLPSVIFWGIRITCIDEKVCKVRIPFSWRTQNPFKSIYFAALAGAAELSTGALCQMLLAGRLQHSMLVTGFRAEYFKKANTDIVFSCDQGLELADLLDTLKDTGDTAQFDMISTGRNSKDEVVAKAYITWSFKRK